MAAPFVQTSFSRGEIAPSLWGHVDWAGWGSAAATCRNLYVGYRGGAYSRAGTAFVGRSAQTFAQSKPRLIQFQFSLSQGYALEFGEAYMRVISKGGYVVEATVNVTAVTQANPGQVTAPSHGYSNGDWVSFASLGGMIQLNGQTAIVTAAAANTFTLRDVDGNSLDTTSYTAYTAGGTVSRIYTLTTPYVASDLPLLKWTQSADVMTLTHPNYAPQELSRLGPTNWTIQAVQIGATISPPTGVAATATVNPSGATSPPTLPCAFAYVVTSVDAKTGQESIASDVANVTNSVDLAATAGSIIVSWSAVTADSTPSYNVYKAPASYNTQPSSSTNALPVPVGSLFGFVGAAYGTQLVDTNITADFAQVPPLHRDPFAPGQVTSVNPTATGAGYTTATGAMTTSTGSGFLCEAIIQSGAVVGYIVVNGGKDYVSSDTFAVTGDGAGATGTPIIGPTTGTYPGVVSYFQQRRVYANSINNPDTYWMSQPGAFNDFDSSIPVTDSDAITGTPWAMQVNGVQWMVAMPLGLVTFTGNDVWQVGPSGTFFSNPTSITPSNQLAVPQSSAGSSATVPPIKINWDIIYLQSKGYTVRAVSYQIYFNTYTGIDISWPSSHLLVGHQLVEWAWCEEPYRVLWAARDDGIMVSLTYLKDQEVMGWARHDTQGQVLSVCSVVEPPVDALYMVVARLVTTGGGGYRYFIERMDNRIWSSSEDPWCVDCGVSLPMPTPNARLYANVSTGAGATFTCSPGVFSAGSIGSVIRMGGGIAVVTSYAGPTQVTGNWLYPCQAILPNDPTGVPLSQAPGNWSLTAPVSTVYAPHLIGKTVVGLSDGVVVTARTVAADGAITLDRAASNIKLGLGYTAQLQSVYLDAGRPTIQGMRKATYAATARIEASGPFQMGSNQTDSSSLSPAPLFSSWVLPAAVPSATSPAAGTQPAYSTASSGSVLPLFTGDVRALVPAAWAKPGQIAVQQSLPQPLNVLALIPEVLPGDQPELGYNEKPRSAAQAAPASRRRSAMPDDLESDAIGRAQGWR